MSGWATKTSGKGNPDLPSTIASSPIPRRSMFVPVVSRS